MKYSLKYAVPILVLMIGLTIMSINTFFYAKYEHDKNIDSMIERISITGNRITTEIENKQLFDKESFAELTRIFSQYTLEHLNVAKIYNSKGEIIFKSLPAKYYKNQEKYDVHSIENVTLDKKSEIHMHEEDMVIDGIFPLAMPLEGDEIYTKKYGALFLQFDMSVSHTQLIEGIYKYSIVNGLVILLMVITLALLLYFLILRRLGNLHVMSSELAKGNYSVRVNSAFNDELGEVNKSFNLMAETISLHNQELQEKIEEAVEKNILQNRLMMQQNRLVAMGEMINNIAHQWRQPLNALGIIMQKFEIFYQRGILDEEKIKENVSRGMVQINKMSSTIDDFRDFFKKDKEMQTFYLKELIDEIAQFMKTIFEENKISFTYDLEFSTEVRAYRNELSQVIINILNNAKDALIENRDADRQITIECRVVQERMVMRIEDNAGGIPEDVIDKVFEPYFSTKDEGKGSGIGLYMSKTIIEENMGGELKVSNSKSGALFEIVLFLDNIHPFCERYCAIEEKENNENR